MNWFALWKALNETAEALLAAEGQRKFARGDCVKFVGTVTGSFHNGKEEWVHVKMPAGNCLTLRAIELKHDEAA